MPRGREKTRARRRNSMLFLPKERVVYGRKPVLELLKHRPRVLEELFVAERSSLPPELEQLISSARERGLLVSQRTKEELDEALADARHQGVAAVLRPLPVTALEEIIERAQSPDRSGVIVVLDQIADPQNLGAVLRVAEASGADGVLVTRDRSAGINATVRKVSAGASELIPIANITNLSRVLKLLRARGFWVAGTSPGEGSVSLFNADLPTPLALVMGAEGKGLRKLTKEHCDVLLEIPMEGRIESLNVSQAASICLYELVRRRKSGIKGAPNSGRGASTPSRGSGKS